MISRLSRLLRRRGTVDAVARVMGIRVLALAGNVLCGLLTARFLGPHGRGEQSAIGVAPLVLGSLCTLGLHASLIYNGRADPEKARQYFGAALLMSLLMGLAASAIGFVVLPTWLDRYPPSVVTDARCLLLVIPFGVMTPIAMSVLEGYGFFPRANRVLYFQSLGTLALLGSLAVAGRLTPMTSATAYVVPTIPSFLYVLWHACHILRPDLSLRAPYPGRLLRFGLRLYGVDIMAVLSGYVDQLLIVMLLAPAAVGAYMVALSLSRVLYVAQGAVATVLFPSIAAREPANVVQMVARAVRVTTLVNVCGALAIAIVGPPMLLLMYGQRFSGAVTPFLILLAEAVVTSAARTLAQAFSGTGRPIAVTAVEFAGVTISITAMLVLVPHYGLIGAATGSLLGGATRLACVMGSFRRVLGVTLPSLLVNRSDLAWVTGR